MNNYVCTVCGYTYDPKTGIPGVISLPERYLKTSRQTGSARSVLSGKTNS